MPTSRPSATFVMGEPSSRFQAGACLAGMTAGWESGRAGVRPNGSRPYRLTTGSAPVCWMPYGQYPSSASSLTGRGESCPLALSVEGGILMARIMPLSCIKCCVLSLLISRMYAAPLAGRSRCVGVIGAGCSGGVLRECINPKACVGCEAISLYDALLSLSLTDGAGLRLDFGAFLSNPTNRGRAGRGRIGGGDVSRSYCMSNLKSLLLGNERGRMRPKIKTYHEYIHKRFSRDMHVFGTIGLYFSYPLPALHAERTPVLASRAQSYRPGCSSGIARGCA